MPITRRDLLRSGTAGLVLPLAAACAGRAPAPVSRDPADGRAVFLHGVASGDPDANSVVLWTRATPGPDLGPVDVEWSLYADPALRRRITGGRVATGAHRDWTVKVLVDGLQPGTSYYYAFEARGERTPIGRTRTLPGPGVERVRIAYTSCSNWVFGFFNAYGGIAARNDLDLVLHLGDYIYEYDNQTYGDGSRFGRLHAPDREIVALDDYRTRYAQYRTDPDLQELHRQHAVVAVWDDHESANNSWRDGAENHDPEKGEGPWPLRKSVAVQAWHEWLPVREGLNQREPRIWRSFALGGMVDLIMLDTRLYGRDREADAPTDRAVIDDPRRTLLGPAQEAWLMDELVRSRDGGAPWRILGQQVMFGQLGGYGDTPILNTDQWDGYPVARARLLDHLEQARIGGVAVLTGDIHSSWAMDIARDPFDAAAYDPATGRGALAVEFVTPSVTSPFLTDPEAARTRAAQGLAAHPHMRFIDLFHKGYVVLDADRDRLQADFWHMDTIDRRDPGERHAAAWATAPGASRLQAVATASPDGTARDPAP
ncbi:MAG: alkaline phosphatase D family protein [Pseudomonadales bacterium]|jgi:alkaline phosphatase D|nr:alkaline phosphatase D family protein [Pseudomonadales bacterium]